MNLTDGSMATPECAMLAPANEQNELNTVLLIGEVGFLLEEPHLFTYISFSHKFIFMKSVWWHMSVLFTYTFHMSLVTFIFSLNQFGDGKGDTVWPSKVEVVEELIFSTFEHSPAGENHHCVIGYHHLSPWYFLVKSRWWELTGISNEEPNELGLEWLSCRSNCKGISWWACLLLYQWSSLLFVICQDGPS